MHRRATSTLLLLTCAVGLGIQPLVASEFPILLKRVPGEANVLVLVDVDRMLTSPMAQERGWKKKLSQDVAQRPMLLPPGAHKLVRAVSVDLNNQAATFEITLLEVPRGMMLSKIAEKRQGYVEKVAGVDAAWLPQGAFAVKLADDLLGLLFPSNRQFLSRWLRERNGQASRFLMDAAYDMKANGPQVMIAIDLEDFVAPGSLAERLKEFASLGESAESLQAMAKVLEGVKGITFGTTFDKHAKARLTVTFEGDAAVLKPIAKPFILSVMASHGLTIDEAEDWQASIDGRKVIFEGELKESGIMRLSSLLELPTDLIDNPEEQTAAENPVLYATQAHYKAVQKLVDDLFGKKWQTFGQYGQWADQYAKKIDRLPLLNVDKDMQEYSGHIAKLLRMGSSDFRGVGIRTGAREGQVTGSGFVTYGYGWGEYYSAEATKGAIRTQERAVGATSSVEMKRQIDEASAAIRKTMVDRYKVNF